MGCCDLCRNACLFSIMWSEKIVMAFIWGESFWRPSASLSLYETGGRGDQRIRKEEGYLFMFTLLFLKGSFSLCFPGTIVSKSFLGWFMSEEINVAALAYLPTEKRVVYYACSTVLHSMYARLYATCKRFAYSWLSLSFRLTSDSWLALHVLSPILLLFRKNSFGLLNVTLISVKIISYLWEFALDLLSGGPIFCRVLIPFFFDWSNSVRVETHWLDCLGTHWIA